MRRELKYLMPMATIAVMALAPAAAAREYFVGGPVHKNDMEIVANYLVGIEMAPMMPNMVHGADVIHLEADVHATADNIYGYPDGAWIAYLTIGYTIEKQGSSWKASGTLKPMTAKDGPHYADNVKMNGPGTYKVTYGFEPPEANVLRVTVRAVASAESLTLRVSKLGGFMSVSAPRIPWTLPALPTLTAVTPPPTKAVGTLTAWMFTVSAPEPPVTVRLAVSPNS